MENQSPATGKLISAIEAGMPPGEWTVNVWPSSQGCLVSVNHDPESWHADIDTWWLGSYFLQTNNLVIQHHWPQGNVCALMQPQIGLTWFDPLTSKELSPFPPEWVFKATVIAAIGWYWLTVIEEHINNPIIFE